MRLEWGVPISGTPYFLRKNVLTKQSNDCGLQIYTECIQSRFGGKLCGWYDFCGIYSEIQYDRWLGHDEGGKIEQVYSDNHSTVEDYGSIDGLCAPGYLVKIDYDLYSAAALEKEKTRDRICRRLIRRDSTGCFIWWEKMKRQDIFLRWTLRIIRKKICSRGRRVFNFRESMASYSADSKGFYRPVYVFMVRTDATDGLEIAISCEK